MPSPSTLKLIGFAVVAIACIVFFGLWRYTALQLETVQGQLETANSTISEHEKNKAITEEVANEYEATIAGLSADVKRLQQRPMRCHAVAGQGGGTDAAATATKLPSGNGIRSDWLYDFAGRCEAERLKVIGLQNFINRTYNE